MPAKPPTHRPPRPTLADGRPTPTQRGYDHHWAALSRSFRERHPICQHCGIRESQHVDHIVPFQRGGARLDEANLQALCRTCHARKSVEEDGGLGRHPRGQGHRESLPS